MNYWTSGGHYRDFTVGKKADALLDPSDPRTGSRTDTAPTPSPYKNKHWPTLYQGHLLNANLGGQATAWNLFPVTPKFNVMHSSTVEEQVKFHLLNLDRLQKDPATQANFLNRRLHYRIDVSNFLNPSFDKFKPRELEGTVFRCVMEYTHNNNGPGLGTGADHTLSHFSVPVKMPAPSNNFNEALSTLGWGPDDDPSHELGSQIGTTTNGKAIHEVIDSNSGAVIAGMTIIT